MFIGEYNHTMDAKGRVSMPSKFRESLGEKFYVTKGIDQCLFVFPMEEWIIFESKLKALPLTNRNARAFTRLFFAGATECVLDKQGRINIPASLREYGNLDREIKVLGVGTRIELWSEDSWKTYSAPENINYEDIEEQMADLGI